MTLFALVRSLKRQHAGQAAGFAAVAIATAAFIGWWVSLPLLSSWGSGFATVKPVVALCLVALGLALMHPGKNSRLAFAVGLAVAAIAALDLLDRFGIDLGINRLNRLLGCRWHLRWWAVRSRSAASKGITSPPLRSAPLPAPFKCSPCWPT